MSLAPDCRRFDQLATYLCPSSRRVMAFNCLLAMPLPADQDNDLAALLARAFVRAWERYFVSGRSETIAEEIARPALARHLVAMAKQGVKREITLAEAGLEYLISLTPRSQAAAPEQGDIIGPQSAIATFAFQAFHFRIERPGAKFLLQWRIPWTL